MTGCHLLSMQITRKGRRTKTAAGIWVAWILGERGDIGTLEAASGKEREKNRLLWATSDKETEEKEQILVLRNGMVRLRAKREAKKSEKSPRP